MKFNIPVKDVTIVNTFIGIGKTIHEFVDANGKDVFLPCISYHLPTIDVWLLSPQNYHQLNGANSIIKVFNFHMVLKNHNIVRPINRQEANLPIIYNAYVTLAQMKRHRPLLRLGMAFIGLGSFHLVGGIRTDRDSSVTEGEVILTYKFESFISSVDPVLDISKIKM